MKKIEKAENIGFNKNHLLFRINSKEYLVHQTDLSDQTITCQEDRKQGVHKTLFKMNDFDQKRFYHVYNTTQIR